MPIPSEYQQATLQFERFMVDARDLAGLATTNMAWNMVVGVLHVFRRRLSVAQALRFADVLPPVLRAIFVSGWAQELDQHPEPLLWTSREALTEEVRALRHEHNFSPPDAIAAVATALRRHVDVQALQHVLDELPAAARDYWQG
jgi:uncharacterized protein (DUF2267 family)